MGLSFNWTLVWLASFVLLLVITYFLVLDKNWFVLHFKFTRELLFLICFISSSKFKLPFLLTTTDPVTYSALHLTFYFTPLKPKTQSNWFFSNFWASFCDSVALLQDKSSFNIEVDDDLLLSRLVSSNGLIINF